MYTLAICAAILVIGVLGIRHLTRGPAGKSGSAKGRPRKVVFISGREVKFGCGHKKRRYADILLENGNEYSRDIPSADAHEFNCHDCFVSTGNEDANLDDRPQAK